MLIPVASKAHTLNEGAELPQESKEAPILKSKGFQPDAGQWLCRTFSGAFGSFFWCLENARLREGHVGHRKRLCWKGWALGRKGAAYILQQG